LFAGFLALQGGTKVGTLADMLTSGRKRLAVYLAIAVVLNLASVLRPFFVANGIEPIAYAAGRVLGTFLLVAVLGEMLTAIVNRSRKP
jgi:hypothetical protein